MIDIENGSITSAFKTFQPGVFAPDWNRPLIDLIKKVIFHSIIQEDYSTSKPSKWRGKKIEFLKYLTQNTAVWKRKKDLCSSLQFKYQILTYCHLSWSVYLTRNHRWFQKIKYPKRNSLKNLSTKKFRSIRQNKIINSLPFIIHRYTLIKIM